MKDREYTELLEKAKRELDRCAEYGWGGTAMYLLVELIGPGLSPRQAVELVQLAESYIENTPGSGNSNQAHD